MIKNRAFHQSIKYWHQGNIYISTWNSTKRDIVSCKYNTRSTDRRTTRASYKFHEHWRRYRCDSWWRSVQFHREEKNHNKLKTKINKMKTINCLKCKAPNYRQKSKSFSKFESMYKYLPKWIQKKYISKGDLRNIL